MKFYRISQEKRPYNIVKVQGGQPDKILPNIVIWAINASQARFLAMNKYPELRSYVEGCLRRNQECDIEAKLDLEKVNELERQKRVNQERQQKKIENAWYMKD